jgi:hypothetical protein
LWTGWALGKLDFIGKNIFCKHGLVVPEEIEHSIVTFMDDLTAHFVTSPKTVDMIKTSFETHPQIWNSDDKYKKLALDIMKSIGTNMLLRIKSAYNSPGTRESDEIVSIPNFEGAFCWAKLSLHLSVMNVGVMILMQPSTVKRYKYSLGISTLEMFLSFIANEYRVHALRSCIWK